MWDKSPSLFADVVERAAVKRSKDIATDMLTAVVDKMPIDTTRAVSNINVSLDNADFTYVENKYVGRGGALASGLGVINRMPNDKLHSVHISDSTPYLKYLEGGSSRQAPNGVFLVSFLGVSAWYR